MNAFITAETNYDLHGHLTKLGVSGSLLCFHKMNVKGAQPCKGLTESPTTDAFVNRGRWVAMCPFGCGSAQVVSETEKYFYCCGKSGCYNEAADFNAVPVIWPNEKMKGQIYEILSRRPRENQNWFPHESLTDLKVENLAHGVV